MSGMPVLELPGVDLWYTDSGGDGVPVVLMHAASGTCESWVYQLPALTAAGYRCIAPDRRGWGRSKPNAKGEQPGYASEDLHELLERLGLDRFHLIGTAAGCAVSVDYTLGHPDRVRSLVISDGTAGVRDPEYLEFHKRMRPPEIEGLPIELREVSPRYRGENPEGLRRWIEIAHASGEATAQRQAPKNDVTLAAMEKLPVPVLAIAGSADITTPPALMRMFVPHLANCEFHLIPEAGHAAFWEVPDDWNQLVLGFIGRY
jgi:pimeloyl-ACP methyl ester carboxylesterase